MIALYRVSVLEPEPLKVFHRQRIESVRLSNSLSVLNLLFSSLSRYTASSVLLATRQLCRARAQESRPQQSLVRLRWMTLAMLRTYS